jgi:hypothetical protein
VEVSGQNRTADRQTIAGMRNGISGAAKKDETRVVQSGCWMTANRASVILSGNGGADKQKPKVWLNFPQIV